MRQWARKTHTYVRFARQATAILNDASYKRAMPCLNIERRAKTSKPNLNNIFITGRPSARGESPPEHGEEGEDFIAESEQYLHNRQAVGPGGKPT